MTYNVFRGTLLDVRCYATQSTRT